MMLFYGEWDPGPGHGVLAVGRASSSDENMYLVTATSASASLLPSLLAGF